MPDEPDDKGAAALGRLQAAFAAAGDPGRSGAMAAYMRRLFPFLGIPATERRALQKDAMRDLGALGEDQLAALVGALWALPEREYQYAACDLISRRAGKCGPTFLAVIERCVRDKAWWDTVDALAANGAGPLVTAHPELAARMDDWAASDDHWLARAALLHQLHFGRSTDRDRLFRYCLLRAGDQDVFLRKAIGWALREYSKVDPVVVRRFVDMNQDVLSPLSRREALAWLKSRSRVQGRHTGEPAGA